MLRYMDPTSPTYFPRFRVQCAWHGNKTELLTFPETVLL